jgi:hypothetical protein
MLTPELKKELEDQGYLQIKEIPGRGICALRKFMFTIGLCHGIDRTGYVGRFCYPHNLAVHAVLAIIDWDGKDDPSGDWIKHKGFPYEYSNSKLISSSR